MSLEPETALSKSLDAIDKIRRRAYLTTILMWVATFAALWRFGYIVRTSDNLKTVMAAAVFALVLTIFLAAFSIVFFITRMTKRLLRAIYTASQGSSSQGG